MPRYIDADALYALVDKAHDFAIQRLLSEPKNLPDGSLNPEYIRDLVRVEERTHIKDEISIAATADVVERKHGKWTERKVIEDGKAIEEWQSARCSVCGKYHTTPYSYYFDDFAYCPNCGAKMCERIIVK